MTEQLTLRVTGMSCTGCEDDVETTVKDIHGVRDATTANHETGTVQVVADEEVDPDYLATAVHNSGDEVVV